MPNSRSQLSVGCAVCTVTDMPKARVRCATARPLGP